MLCGRRGSTLIRAGIEYKQAQNKTATVSRLLNSASKTAIYLSSLIFCVMVMESENRVSKKSTPSNLRTRKVRRPLGVIRNDTWPNRRDSSKLQTTTIAPPQLRPNTNSPPVRAESIVKQSKPRASTVLDTNPYQTKALWNEVISATRGTKSSEGKKAQGLVLGGRGTGRGRGIVAGLTRVGSSTTSSETGSQSQTERSKNLTAKPSDNDFYELVLLPRGIVIDGSTPSMLAFTHFSSSQPTGQRRAYYRKESGSDASQVWLESDEAFVRDVIGEYNWMTTHRSCEAEFALYGKETLIKRETRHISRDQRVWVTHRMVELVTKPKTVDLRAPARSPTPWWSPPLLDPVLPNKPYSYDIRPDCQYWLSLNFANRQYKRLYKDFVFENDGEAVCPYFTIEFKKDNISYDTATNQLATAAALALHNRCILKHRYLQTINRSWSETDAQTIKHYGLTFAGSEYQFWCIQPVVLEQDITADWTWCGCKMSNVSRGKLLGEVEVEDFIDWVNEIHRWGLTVYGQACEADVKACIDHGPSGVRTSSAVAPDPG